MDECKWCFEKNVLPLQKFDALNTVAVPKNTTVPRKKIKAISTLKEQLLGESSC